MVELVVLSWWLDLIILRVFCNQNDSDSFSVDFTEIDSATVLNFEYQKNKKDSILIKHFASGLTHILVS